MYYVNESEVPSQSKHLTYKIRKGDTLEGVANALGIEAQDLRRYHNIYCEISDLIEADFKNHLEYLILAPVRNAGDAVEKKPRKVSLGNNYRLPFSPEQMNESYKVKYTAQAGDEIDVTEMKISVKWIAADKKKYHLFEINRASDIYINGKMPDTMMNGLAAKTAEVLYPLKIVVDEFGKWIDIYNYPEIESRWGTIKREILDYCEGEVVEKYIKHVESTLESSERLLSSLRSDYFLRAFFNGIHVAYTADYEFKNDVSFPLEKGEESLFKAEQKIDPFLDDSYLVKVEQKGDYKDSESEVNFGYNPRKGYYNATYLLDKDSYWIEKINMKCSIDYDDPIKVAIALEPLEKRKELN